MTLPHPPADEPARLAALRRLEVLDTAPEADYDDIARLAAQVCDAPVALMTLVAAERIWFKARLGTDISDVAREGAFCDLAIRTPERPLVVADTHADARFGMRPDDPVLAGVRFYAGVPIVDADGAALGTVCVLDRRPRRLDAAQLESLRALSRQAARLLALRGLSERRARMAQVSRSEAERLLALALSALDLQAFIDPDLRFRHVNATHARYWGRPPHEIEGLPVRDLYGDAAFERHVRHRLERALAGETIHCHLSVDFPAQGLRRMEVAWLPARSADGEVIGVVVRAHDVQALVDAEASLRAACEQLEDRNRMQQRFIHLLSHDLCEPVNTIVNFSTLLHERVGGALGPEARRWLAFVRAGGLRMRTLLADLLDLLRLERTPLAPAAVPLDAVMREVLADLDAAIVSSRARVDVRALAVVDGERTLLRLLLQNLVGNAIKFAHPDRPPRVVVRMEPSATAWRVVVEDNGIGIPEAHREQVFELFQRLHPRSRFDGSGLGLSICRQIAQMHGGTVELESVEGVGSAFRVAWPRMAAPAGDTP